MRTHQEIINVIYNQPDVMEGVLPHVQEKFMEWIPDNLHVFDAFERNAVYLKTNGKRDKYSVYVIREKLHWDSLLQEEGSDFKLNNNFSSSIARIVMALNPQLAGMFTIRNHAANDDSYKAVA